MSYSNGEMLILAALRSISGGVWTVSNSGVGKWNLLNTGKADHYAILKPGAFVHSFQAASNSLTEWRTVIEVWQRYKDDSDSLLSLEALSAAIIQKFDQENRLDDTTDTVQDSVCSGGGEVTEQWTKGGGPAWLKQEIFIDWKEEANVTFS